MEHTSQQIPGIPISASGILFFILWCLVRALLSYFSITPVELFFLDMYIF